MTKDEALKLALEAITKFLAESPEPSEEAVEGLCDAASMARKALAQPAQLTEKEKISREMTAEIAASRALAQPAQEPLNKYCCHLCFNKSGKMFLDRMILCPECGNKRCPKASYHELPCTNSNEPNQRGSIYNTPPQPAQEPVGMVKELFTQTAWEKLDLRGNTKVYITPPQREPLTDEAVLDIADYCLCDGGKTYGVLDFARAIEAAHGIKE